ncbi:hypothetical protein Anapl_17129 [Anas platyrhynchos]|uniref:Uncharacterized protein n=1 Tax=Anas platyrhynchos TaxID=8839 RepID=R0L8J8_ANAPL|nr:hypothetical protein Anapl_17129 [Anas platyrhynchos]
MRQEEPAAKTGIWDEVQVPAFKTGRAETSDKQRIYASALPESLRSSLNQFSMEPYETADEDNPVTVERAGALPSAFLHIQVKADKEGAVQSEESSQAANTIFCSLQQESRTQFPRDPDAVKFLHRTFHLQQKEQEEIAIVSRYSCV